ncbi:MAG: response regulator, partial [Armatimonadetes bacterium]|nr:response regulator [Armatimonadota bacterium]
MHRVLVVDDDQSARRILRWILESAGCRIVTEVASGEHAVGAFLETMPELTFLDVHLPIRDGLSILRGIKEVDPDAHVILISADADSAVVRQAVELGAAGYVLKPLDRGRVLGLVARLTAREAVNEQKLRRPRVLLVEDHEPFRAVLRLAVGDAGCTLVGEAADARQAVAAAERLGPDLAVVDLGLPDAGGMQAVVEMQKAAPDMRLVVATSVSDGTTVAQALAMGVTGYLVKPYGRTKAAAAIREALTQQV